MTTVLLIYVLVLLALLFGAFALVVRLAQLRIAAEWELEVVRAAAREERARHELRRGKLELAEEEVTVLRAKLAERDEWMDLCHELVRVFDVQQTKGISGAWHASGCPCDLCVRERARRARLYREAYEDARRNR